MCAERMDNHMNVQRRIGIFGGSFDPIHFGHLNLAIELLEIHRLDEVWFVPALLNPHKLDRPHRKLCHRKAMIELAIKDIPQFYMKDLEGHREPPSFTIDTVSHLMDCEKNNPHPRQFFLLLGEDSIRDFFQWRHPEKIVSLVPLLIGSRAGQWMLQNPAGLDQSIVKAIQAGITKTKMMDISSTDLRERLRDGRYCGHLLPSELIEYIATHQLY